MGTRNLFIFLGGWFLLNGVQAFFTDLANDEAYYWVYSLRLDWGYFDHPPMVALLARLGYTLFQNEFGVRLFTIVSQLTAIFLLYKYLLPSQYIETRSRSILLVVVLIPILHVFAFIATPDAPILLTAVIFLIFYKKFITDNSWVNALFLGVSMALMLYSKYHGVLIIGFIILSNPKILLDYKFWAGSMFGACLFIPHLVWQFVNDFPSLHYHLVDRNSPFEFKNFWVYLMNQLINFNPVILITVCVNLFRFKIPDDKFERGLVFLLVGFFGFFLVMTYRGHIEPQWTYVLVIPILYWVVKYSTDSQLRTILYSGVIVLPLLILGRVFLIFDILPKTNEFHGYPSLVKEIHRNTQGLPVFVLNSYQLSSKYHFYNREWAYGLNSGGGRHNQHDLWRDEEQFFGKRVYVVSTWPIRNFAKLNAEGPYNAFGRVIDDFAFYKDVKIEWRGEAIAKSENFQDSIVTENPYNTPVVLKKTQLIMLLTDNKNIRMEIELETDTDTLPAKTVSIVRVKSKAKIPPGEYSVRFILRPANQFYSTNSPSYPVTFR